MIRGQELTLRNYKEKSVISTLDNIIPTAAMLGGVIIGFMTVLGDLLNVAGSSTGIMLSISILYGYYEKMSPKEQILEEFWYDRRCFLFNYLIGLLPGKFLCLFHHAIIFNSFCIFFPNLNSSKKEKREENKTKWEYFSLH